MRTTSKALAALLLAGLSTGCEQVTSLLVRATSSVEVSSITIRIAIDGQAAVDRSLTALGDVVVLLPNRDAEVVVTLEATGPADEALSVTGSIAVKRGARAELALTLGASAVDLGADASYTGPVQITVALTGDGVGSVTGGGIACPATCSIVQPMATEISLIAAPAVGSVFSAWTSGPCTGASTPTCKFVPSSPVITATADFVRSGRVLTVSATNNPGSSLGAVSSAPVGISCGTSCAAAFPDASIVVLTATPAPGEGIAWGGACSGQYGTTCNVTMDQARDVAAVFTKANLAFVTSVQHGTNFGGLGGADTFCQQRAAAGGLQGDYVAWLSTSTTSAISRLGASRGWLRTDGLPFVDTTTDLAASRIFYPLRATELGAPLADTDNHDVFTGTSQSGTYVGAGFDFTQGWTVDGNVLGAKAYDGGGAWTYRYIFNGSARIYCFGIGAINPVIVPAIPPGGRRAFVSSTAVTKDMGVGGFDGVCAADAASASLTGTFRAVIATSTFSAASRFNALGGAWYRVDGVKLAATAADLFSPKILLAPLGLNQHGARLASSTILGQFSPTAPAPNAASYTCDNWMSTVNNGTAHFSEESRWWLTSGMAFTGCSGSASLYCLEE